MEPEPGLFTFALLSKPCPKNFITGSHDRVVSECGIVYERVPGLNAYWVQHDKVRIGTFEIFPHTAPLLAFAPKEGYTIMDWVAVDVAARLSELNDHIVETQQPRIRGRSLDQVAELVHQIAADKGWHDEKYNEDAFIERACNNLHNEISELHEAWRNNKLHAPCDKAEAMKAVGLEPLTCLQEEMADIVIRALDNAKRMGVDIEYVVSQKSAFNKTRPHRHGGKRS